mmetsp:Transcript_21571/g.35604  ORF Transcript_21571/g.35604 Transcript_21571/m.35604 type:complete len:122 (-) Transcript_21571:359-724(-)|eukprot:CAMPEP_0119313098 /NCGR_PEP_ID=MMETSP1333-20130426/27885_1 /TAXON_ID=418940 /ORGANISM="Scyphosphaera apsteinii, Strain RCC1455" /LENGTH=121 /DNA_ID=CAMNT_0007317843 /DNA_START=42 /DNA_END=407 /DNA_ORIENTATION=-
MQYPDAYGNMDNSRLSEWVGGQGTWAQQGSKVWLKVPGVPADVENVEDLVVHITKQSLKILWKTNVLCRGDFFHNILPEESKLTLEPDETDSSKKQLNIEVKKERGVIDWQQCFYSDNGLI